MKKSFTVFVSVVIVLTLLLCFASCDKDDEIVNVYVPDGAPALTVANLFANNSIGGKKINVVITTGLNVRAKLLSGEADIAVCPTNMAATIYNANKSHKLLTVNLFGLLYLVGNGQATKLDDLVGHVVYSIGKNNTPEYVFKKILSEANIDYVDSDVAVDGKVAIRYFETGATIIPLLQSKEAEFAILGEPDATKSEAAELFDLQRLWQESTNLDGYYPQAGLFVSDELLTNNADFISALVTALDDNSDYIIKNAQTVCKLLADNGSADFNGLTLTQKTIERCNIRCVNASECKQQLTAYFEAIKTVNPNFTLPDDGFYAN